VLGSLLPLFFLSFPSPPPSTLPLPPLPFLFFINSASQRPGRDATRLPAYRGWGLPCFCPREGLRSALREIGASSRGIGRRNYRFSSSSRFLFPRTLRCSRSCRLGHGPLFSLYFWFPVSAEIPRDHGCPRSAIECSATFSFALFCLPSDVYYVFICFRLFLR
jgi:hypothetical protein